MTRPQSVRCLVGLFALLCLGASAVFSQSEPLSLAQYVSQVDHYRQTLHDSAGDPASLHSLRASLPARWVVNSQGQQFSVSTDWLRDEIGQVENQPSLKHYLLRQAEQRLQLMADSARELAMQSSAGDPDAIHLQLGKILNSREFRDTAPRSPTALDRLRARIRRWFDRLLERVFGQVHLGSTSRSLIAWAVITLVALLLMYGAVRYTLGGSDSTGIDYSRVAVPGLAWHQWLGRAREAAERGDYRLAIHAAYWTGVTRLEETKLVPQDESQTPREILRLLRREQGEYTPLARLTKNFELVWYGRRAATAAEWQDALQQLDKIGCPLPWTLKTANS